MNQQPDPIGVNRSKRPSTGLIIGIVVGVVLLVTCVGGVGLMALLMPGLNSARESAREVVVMSNLRQVMMGMATYASQHEDRLPPVEEWHALIGQEVGSSGPALFDSPRVEGKGYEMAYAPPRYADGSMARTRDVEAPSRWVLVYEDGLAPTYENVAAGFLDGHVAMVTRTEIDIAMARQSKPVAKRSGSE